MSVLHYPYLDGPLRFPAPFVNVMLRNLQGTAEWGSQPAQVDSAADWTVFPMKTVEALGLMPVDELAVGGLGGTRVLMRTFAVYLAVQNFPPQLLEVLGHEEEPWILLGRDILNGLRIVLDGPNLGLEVHPPSGN